MLIVTSTRNGTIFRASFPKLIGETKFRTTQGNWMGRYSIKASLENHSWRWSKERTASFEGLPLIPVDLWPLRSTKILLKFQETRPVNSNPLPLRLSTLSYIVSIDISNKVWLYHCTCTRVNGWKDYSPMPISILWIELVRFGLRSRFSRRIWEIFTLKRSWYCTTLNELFFWNNFE